MAVGILLKTQDRKLVYTRRRDAAQLLQVAMSSHLLDSTGFRDKERDAVIIGLGLGFRRSFVFNMPSTNSMTLLRSLSS